MSYTEIPQWINELPEKVSCWLKTVMNKERFGLFMDCVDSEVPFTLPASTIGLSRLMMVDSILLEQVSGYSPERLRETVLYIQNCQQPDTGYFIDPYLDERFVNKHDTEEYKAFRRAITKYSIEFLSCLNAEPLYKCSQTSEKGNPDPQEYLRYIKNGDWDKPWAIGSHAGIQTRELFYLINEGQEKYIESVCEGIDFILSKQNPETGMWGKSSIPLFEQISGTLKIVGRLKFNFGMDIPYLDKLADSCIKYHSNGGFYSEVDDLLLPRNVAEMCIACLESSDYRREEILETLKSLVHLMSKYQMPDGAFASEQTGKHRIQWCGAQISMVSQKPRSNMVGTQAILYILGLLSSYLGWENFKISNPLGNWQEKIEKLKYRIVLNTSGKVEIVKK